MAFLATVVALALAAPRAASLGGGVCGESLVALPVPALALRLGLVLGHVLKSCVHAVHVKTSAACMWPDRHFRDSTDSKVYTYHRERQQKNLGE